MPILSAFVDFMSCQVNRSRQSSCAAGIIVVCFIWWSRSEIITQWLSEHVIAEHQELHDSDIRVLRDRIHSHRSSMWMYTADEAGTCADWKVNCVSFLVQTKGFIKSAVSLSGLHWNKSGQWTCLANCYVWSNIDLGTWKNFWWKPSSNILYHVDYVHKDQSFEMVIWWSSG